MHCKIWEIKYIFFDNIDMIICEMLKAKENLNPNAFELLNPSPNSNAKYL